ncbi:MAG: DMT family transporter [Pseudomonadota bacterium]
MLMLATMLVFAAQDGISRHLASSYNVILVVMLRYWFFAAFVVAISARRPGGLRAAARTSQHWLQIGRGVLLVVEICVMVLAFTRLGLVGSHAIFATYPLLVAALSGPVLGEPVGWRRWVAIGVGFVGVLIILRPGFAVFSPDALIALLSAFLFATYALLTRFAARRDTAATSFFWTGVAGAAAITLVGPFFWQPMLPADWAWMAVLCVTGALGHYLLIKTYEVAEASSVQPLAYFQLVFASAIGLLVFGEMLDLPTALGAAIVVSAGLYTLWRERRRDTAT